jgi:hypothetical protein
MEKFYGCAPLRVGNRIEVRARTQQFDRALRAESGDPLWMLGRQWQFGEFQGEDAGSPIFAKVKLSSSPLNTLTTRAGDTQALDGAVPLEAAVERSAVSFDTPTRAHLGRQWLRLLTREAAAFAAAGGSPAMDLDAYRTLFIGAYGFKPDQGVAAEPVALRDAQRASDSRIQSLLMALQGRSVDGLAVYRAFAATLFKSLPVDLVPLAPAHAAPLIATAKQFDKYFRRHHGDIDATSAWEAAQLEYRFSCSCSGADGRQVSVTADEAFSGPISWHGFDLSSSAPTSVPPTSHIATRIPTPAQFPGMPKPRFWEFEDGEVDLGNIHSDSTDAVKLLLSEFALIYGGNWFVIPCQQPAGSLAGVEGIIVTDVFGRRTLVLPANRTAERGWSRWDMFTLSTPRGQEIAPMFLIPPGVVERQEGAVIESATLLRDEATNTVWAVETRVSDGLGASRDASAVTREITAHLAVDPGGSPTSATGQLKYVLGNTVPLNWIPFIPVHRDAQQRSVQLQRAAMPRISSAGVHAVRPLTDVLRTGIRSDDSQQQPYFINEEEIPQAGLIVSASYRRARWYGGSTHVWLGRQKQLGRGLGSSGLDFDLVQAPPA